MAYLPTSPLKLFTKQQGFSLVELIAVIVILGILSTASVKFIEFGTRIYVEANERQVVLSQSRFAIERMTREIRAAIPHSIRVSSNNACIEFVPIKSSGAYRDDSDAVEPPIDPSSGTALEVISWNGTYAVGDRVYIYATANNEVYTSSTEKFSELTATNVTGQEVTFTFPANTQFAEHSPRRRYYTADESINYCLIANGSNYDLYRFTETSFSSTQTVPSLAYGVLMAEGLSNDLSEASDYPFTYEGDTLNRNSVVNLYLEFNANSDENMFFNHEVHIPNVP